MPDPYGRECTLGGVQRTLQGPSSWGSSKYGTLARPSDVGGLDGVIGP